MSKYIFAHDTGTSGNKATLFTTDGEFVASELYPYDAHYFNDVWVEENADDWWKAVCVTSNNLIRKTKIDPKDIAVISFSGQMIGCLCVDKEGRPLRPSIIWADQRSTAQAAAIKEKIDEREFYKISGHPIKASYAGLKLMWVRDNEPDIYKATYKTLNSKDYMVFKLTGKFCTDHSDAHSLTCYDMLGRCWSDELVDIMGLDHDKLPEIVESTTVVGEVTKQAAQETGFAPGTPVVMGAGDGPAGNVGAGSVAPGQAYVSLGTSSWIAVTADKPFYDYDRMSVVTWAHAVPGLYSPNGTMQYGGGSYNWLKETMCMWEKEQAKEKGCSPYDIINAEIATAGPGSGGLFFLPYLIGERSPWWDEKARGCWIGIRAETTRAQMFRSVLEGVTFNLNNVMNILRENISIGRMTAIGGGAKGPVWQQILADVFDVEIVVPSVIQESNSMGAAVIGGVGAGIFKDFNAIQKFFSIEKTIEPNPEAVRLYKQYQPVFEECYLTLKDTFKHLSELQG